MVQVEYYEGWWRSPYCLVFFCDFLHPASGNFLGGFEVLTELDELRESLGFCFETLNDQFFLPLLQE